MKHILISVTLLSLFLQMGCNNVSSSSGVFSVKGKIYNTQGPVQNAKISIDNAINWTTYSSDNGDFEIKNVSEGKHTITIVKENADSSFSERSETVSVYSNTNLSLLLPKPVKLLNPQNITVNSIGLVWETTDAEDFVEYKVYRRDTPGLDETTGELIYVSTNKTDTTFEDTGLYSDKKYYYRVYVMNNYGKLGGSNIVNSATLKGNLIVNGNFESNSNVLDYWNISGSGSTVLDSIVFYQDNKSMHIKTPFVSSGSSTTLLSETIYIEPNKLHVFSGWFKIEGKKTADLNLWVAIKQGEHVTSNEIIIDDPNSWRGDEFSMDWANQEFSFYVNTNEPIRIMIVAGTENVWIDEMSLIKQ
ncbi:MAG TPA: hypothetical protein ENK44_14385 [Caldithrix abyssi]|uniref:Fibronectin type-III domain-containing protein n=1 Tax=Caldithrix abyssi TaxID=187145 RepID=A0A7V4U3U4_CALAY|nr:hypothetical protein [Caldithrix abyssi]